ncbi:MAG: N-acetylglucosamine kinase [Armatimonadota bacterium]
MRRYALGIDGGGSKCDAALLDQGGAVVGWGRGGPVHVYYDPPEVIANSYSEAIAEALAGVSGGEVYVAGQLPSGRPRETVERSNTLARHVVATEVDTAFACAQEEWGLIVLSGTGSFVHARGPGGGVRKPRQRRLHEACAQRPDRAAPVRPCAGRDLHFGGLGPILNDYGSAYEIGLRGLRAAFASNWTAARRTSLADALVRALGVSTLRDIFNLVYVEGFGRRQIAALAEVVDAEAEAGDRVARECVERAAGELAEIACEAIRELAMESLEFAAIGIGGVAQGSKLWWARVCERLRGCAPGVRPVIPPLPPAVGAALIALREMGVAWTPEVVRRATTSYRERAASSR